MKMNENVLRRVRMIEEKSGISYAKTDGRLHKTLRVIYHILFIYTLGINLIFILGMLLVRLGTDSFAAIKPTVITVGVCTVVMTAGYILSFFKFKLTAGILSIAPEIFLIPVFGTAMTDSLGFMGFKPSFYWRHLAPLALLAILITLTTVIAVREKIKTEKQYKKVSENLYRQFNINASDKGVTVTDEQWEEFLSNYDPTDYKKLFETKKTTDE